jgi:hypothetical protein
MLRKLWLRKFGSLLVDPRKCLLCIERRKIICHRINSYWLLHLFDNRNDWFQCLWLFNLFELSALWLSSLKISHDLDHILKFKDRFGLLLLLLLLDWCLVSCSFKWGQLRRFKYIFSADWRENNGILSIWFEIVERLKMLNKAEIIYLSSRWETFTDN